MIKFFKSFVLSNILFNEFIFEFGDRDDIIHYSYQDGYLSIVFYDEENVLDYTEHKLDPLFDEFSF